jgi:hypothetical protein
MQDFEKLGVFYLGRLYDLKNKAPKDELCYTLKTWSPRCALA